MDLRTLELKLAEAKKANKEAGRLYDWTASCVDVLEQDIAEYKGNRGLASGAPGAGSGPSGGGPLAASAPTSWPAAQVPPSAPGRSRSPRCDPLIQEIVRQLHKNKYYDAEEGIRLA